MDSEFALGEAGDATREAGQVESTSSTIGGVPRRFFPDAESLRGAGDRRVRHTVRFWEATRGICYRTLQYADSQVNKLEITPDKRYRGRGNPHPTL